MLVVEWASHLRMRKPRLFGVEAALPMPGPSPSSKPSRSLCLATACLAFTLGTVVGAIVAFVLLPGLPYQDLTNLTLPVTETKASVTFVEPLKVNISHVRPEPIEITETNVIHIHSETVDGIFWSENVENLLPKGFTEEIEEEWIRYLKKSRIARLEEGCGRMQNRLVIFDNGKRSCGRYRQNFDQIQGEIFSYYLARLLGIRNLPPTSLALVRPEKEKWFNIRSQLTLAQWNEDRPVVLTQFIEGLEPALIPPVLRNSTRRLHPSDISQFRVDEDVEQLKELAQWSELIIFDYLTANLDRVVNNMYNLQWNPQMMDAPAHNLVKDPQSGLLIFLDNESGLLHGYRLLDKYEHYHKLLLDSMCVFRRRTVKRLRKLQSGKNIGSLMKDLFESREKEVSDYLPFLPDKTIKILMQRIDRVLSQVDRCENLYQS
ncbi:extracellular serine/threonine protein kinase four-jointed-like [Artemia franciscana]|uniref:Uncharacterized protein n=1 Tax=Artemia franciscana TaxID=6661 RepID=A0AA88HSJ1_ARTSF|nr:hypothetical protein QYM36_011513 [Artemia franciscana]